MIQFDRTKKKLVEILTLKTYIVVKFQKICSHSLATLLINFDLFP